MSRHLKLLLRLSLSCALLALLFYKIPVGIVWEQLQETKIRWFVLSIVLGEIVMLNMAFRWRHLLLIPSSEKPPVWVFFKFTAIGYFFNLLMPTGFGGDVVKAFLFGKKLNAMAASVASTALARVLGFSALIGLFWIGALWTHRFDWIAVVVMSGFSFFMALGVFLAMQEGVLTKLAARKSNLLISIAAFFRKLHEYKGLRRIVGVGLIDSIVMQLLLILIQWCFFAASGAEVAFVDLLVLIPLVTIATMIPISFYGIGFREWAILTFLPTGYNPKMVLAGVALGYGLVLLQALQGVVFLVWTRPVSAQVVREGN